MIAKLKIVEEELDESLYWMEVLVCSDILPKEDLFDLHREANELLSIVVASIISLRSRPSAVHEEVPVYALEQEGLSETCIE